MPILFVDSDAFGSLAVAVPASFVGWAVSSLMIAIAEVASFGFWTVPLEVSWFAAIITLLLSRVIGRYPHVSLTVN